MEEVNTTTILINVLAQIVNLILFFWILKKLVGQPIVEQLQKRKELLQKLQKADEEYQKIIEEAKSKAQQIIDEATQSKKTILQEAQLKADEIVKKATHQAQKRADDILHQAQLEAQKIKASLEAWWEEAVKKTTQLVVKKLLQDDVSLQDAYLKKLVEEFKNSK